MSATLSDEQVEQFWTNGFVSPVPVLTADEAAHYLAWLERIEAEQVEACGGTWDTRDYRPGRDTDHPMKPWLHELAHHPRILDAVSSILGPDVLVRNGDVFIKNPGVRRGIREHRDTAMLGDVTDHLVNIWVGLTPSTPQNGGLWFYRGSHRLDLADGPKDRFTLTLTPGAIGELDKGTVFHNVLEPGQASMHHFSTIHASGPNMTRERRVAFVGRYMSPHCTQEIAECGQAKLMRGTDTVGNFQLTDDFPMTWTMP